MLSVSVRWWLGVGTVATLRGWRVQRESAAAARGGSAEVAPRPSAQPPICAQLIAAVSRCPRLTPPLRPLNQPLASPLRQRPLRGLPKMQIRGSGHLAAGLCVPSSAVPPPTCGCEPRDVARGFAPAPSSARRRTGRIRPYAGRLSGYLGGRLAPPGFAPKSASPSLPLRG